MNGFRLLNIGSHGRTKKAVGSLSKEGRPHPGACGDDSPLEGGLPTEARRKRNTGKFLYFGKKIA